MLSTPIGKGYIILINDKSLWGKYVLRNADFRFSAQIRSHFLLHQEANPHRSFEGQPYFRPSLIGDTIRDILWDIPSFCCPSICPPLGTLLGTSLLFYCPLIVTPIVTSIGISQHFRPHRFATNRDVFNYIQLICHRFCKRTIGTLFVTPLQYPKQNNSSGLSQFSNQS